MTGPRLQRAASAGLALALLLTALLGAGCRGRAKEDPILRLSAQEALEIGKALMEEKKYRKAREHFTHAFEVEPNSAGGREALLLSADAFYLSGGRENYLRAESKYRDFQNRFPTSERSAYVQYQIASSLAKRMLKPDRDQSPSRKALEAFEEVIRLYPSSEYAAQAREQIGVVRNNLAEHEYVVGEFNLRMGLAAAAAKRFDTLLSEYPDYPERDKALYHLVRAYRRTGEEEKMREARTRLETEYPDSPWVEEVRKLKPIKRKAEE